MNEIGHGFDSGQGTKPASYSRAIVVWVILYIKAGDCPVLSHSVFELQPFNSFPVHSKGSSDDANGLNGCSQMDFSLV